MFNTKTKYRIQTLETELRWLKERNERYRDEIMEFGRDMDRLMKHLGLEFGDIPPARVVVKIK